MGLRLGERVFLLLALVNLLIFAAAGLYLVQRLAAERSRLELELAGDLLKTLEGTILPQGELNVPRILGWSGWTEIDDAVLVDRNLVALPGGSVRPAGINLNPVGRARRASPTAERTVLEALWRVCQGGGPQAVAGGRAVPIVSQSAVWGAVWYRPKERTTGRDMLEALLPAFFISTSLLVGGSFLALRRLVLDPVERLAAGARRLQAGEFATRVEGTGRRDELAELVEAFNAMAGTVEAYHTALAERAEEAAEKARRVESAAMIQRRLAAMGELAAGIAHEINNPLGGMLNAVESLAKPDLSPERRERYLALVAQGLERVRETVGRVLRMAPREARHGAVDLTPVVEDTLALVRHRAEAAGLQLAFVPPTARVYVLGAANDLGQALLNLVTNALDALEEGRARGGRASGLEVQLSARDGEVRLAVVDDGPGVSQEDLPRLADLFYTTKDVGRGTGLGLALVHSVVQAHGGRVLLASEPGAGFTAEILLPEHKGSRP